MTIPVPHQGAELGLPATGPGSVAPLGRRFLAILIDWALCMIIATGIFQMPWGEVSGAQSFLPLGLLFAENLLLVTTIGSTVGHWLLGLRVISVDALAQGMTSPPPPVRSAVRAALLCLAIPPVIMDVNMRGLHDKAARSVVVRAG